LRADDSPSLQLHDSYQTIEPGLRRQRPNPLLLYSALDHRDVLIELARLARGIRFALACGGGQHVLFPLALRGSLAFALSRFLALALLARLALLVRGSLALALFAGLLLAALRRRLVGRDAVAFLLRGIVPSALLGCDALLLALLRLALLLGHFATLAVLALLALAFLPRGIFARFLLTLDRRGVDDRADDRRRGNFDTRPLRERDARHEDSQHCDVQYQRPNDRSLVLTHDALTHR
jgi:hypothetical protein